jgi:FkbM family methyltransferase
VRSGWSPGKSGLRFNAGLVLAATGTVNRTDDPPNREIDFMYQRVINYINSTRDLGFVNAVLNKVQRARLSRGQSVSLRSKYARAPLACRANTSDVHVFGQIFYAREYRCLDQIKEADLIIDCGANVGYSAAYFLSRFPSATLVAIEPDPQNFSALEANLRAYGKRAKCVCSGIWSRSTGLIFSRDTLGEGQEWARTVREVREGEASDVNAIDIGSILAQSGIKRISILKIDIEGSEIAVFSSNYQSWIDKVDNLVIELHGAECERVFHKAIAGLGFEISTCDELTVCLKRKA